MINLFKVFIYSLVVRCTVMYYCFNMVMIALTCVASTVILYISHHYQDKPVPVWARKVRNLIKVHTKFA